MNDITAWLREQANRIEKATGQQTYLYTSCPTKRSIRYVFVDRTHTSTPRAHVHMEEKLKEAGLS